MVVRFLLPCVHDALEQVALTQPGKDANVGIINLPNDEALLVLQQVLLVLERLKRCTVILQGEQYVTLSAVYPYVASMVHHINIMGRNNQFHASVRAFAKALVTAFEVRLNL